MDLPRTFADVPNREWALETDNAQRLLDSLPPAIRESLIQYFLNPSSINPKELIDYFVNNSKILNFEYSSKGNARGFEYLYTRKVSTPIDQYSIESKAGFQIHQRLRALESNLPFWLDRLLDDKSTILVDNIGSGTGRDMLGVLAKNPRFNGKVKVRHIDPDTESLSISKRLAKEMGISNAFFSMATNSVKCHLQRLI